MKSLARLGVAIHFRLRYQTATMRASEARRLDIRATFLARMGVRSGNERGWTRTIATVTS